LHADELEGWLPSFRPVAAAIAALLLASRVQGEDAAAALANRFSIAGIVAPPDSGLTLLDPSWLLPPIESLDLAAAEDRVHAGQHLLDDSLVAAPRPPKEPSPTGPLTYTLSEALTTQLRYRHSLAFDRASSKPLRDDPSTAFSTSFNRDVLDLNMSWRLAGSTVGVGYQLQSTRGATLAENVGLSRFLPGSEQATHSLTFGLTRQWGATAPPIEPLLLPPELDTAVTETTPTPVP
jgi:hypothetical protein